MEKLVYLVSSEVIEERFSKAVTEAGYKLQIIQDGNTALHMARMDLPCILLISEKLSDMTNLRLCHLFKKDTKLQSTWLIAITPECTSEFMVSDADDWISPAESELNLTWKLQLGEKMHYRSVHINQLNKKVNSKEKDLSQGNLHLERITEDLVEMAASMQAELCHSAEEHAVEVKSAKRNVLSQAAATLRHEINNPLFVITGTIQSLQLHVDRAIDQETELSRTVHRDVARIMTGARRIESVVQAISAMLDPITTEYVNGEQILDIHLKENIA